MAAAASAASKYKICIGIDFGTTGTAAAWSLMQQDRGAAGSAGDVKINLCTTLPRLYRVQDTFKAPARVALSPVPPHKLVAFGTDVDQLMTLAGQDVLVFHRFKMHLYRGETAAAGAPVARRGDPMDMLVAADNRSGSFVPLRTVIARSLEAVRVTALREIDRAAGFKFLPEEVRWVVTVPAIWDEGAKAGMMRVAVEAGMIPDAASEQLLIALEPECAALDAYQRDLQVKVGGTYMVVDAGGGTIDITMHRLSAGPDGCLVAEEVHKASGNDMGCTSVDRAFVAFLEELMPGFDATRGSQETREELYRLLSSDWEVAKQRFGSKSEQEPVAVSLRYLCDTLSDDMDLKECMVEYNKSHPGIALAQGGRGSITMPAALMRSFFEPTLRSITALLRSLCASKAGKNLSGILLVGGFANCMLLQEAVKAVSAEFRCEVTVPTNPHMCVVNGAVRFGVTEGQPRQPGGIVIGSRRARMTYGVRYRRVLREGEVVPTGSPKEGVPKVEFDIKDQANYIKNALQVFVPADELVAADSVVRHTFTPPYDDSTSTCITMIEAASPHVKYIGNGNAHELGSVTVRVDPSIPRLQNTITVEMQFGATAIKMTATTSLGTERLTLNVGWGK